MVDCWLPYGETEVYISVELKDLLGIAEPVMVDPEKKAAQLISDALMNPVGEKLGELVGEQDNVVIAVDVYSNPQPVIQTLKELVKTLVELIIPRDRITILIGNSEGEKGSSTLHEAISETTDLKNVQIIEHNKGVSTFVDVGETHRGTEVKINPVYHGATLKIALGETRLDQYTGFTGAHSAVIPGLVSIDTITKSRKHYFDGEVKLGSIELNPIKEDTVEAVKLVGVDFSVNLITNSEGQILAVHTGSFEESWGRAINSLSNMYDISHKGDADIVVSSAGGTPFDQTLYSATLALLNSSKAAKKNGTLILLSECKGGLGADAYTQLANVSDLSEFKRRYMYGAEALQVLKRLLKSHRIILVSALSEYLVESLGMESARTANEAYSKAVQGRRGRRTTIIPLGIQSNLSIK